MKTITIIAIFVILLFIAGGAQISLKPFSIKFKDLPVMFGLLFLLLALACYQYSAYKRGVTKGYKQAIEDIRTAVDSVKNTYS